ncbi:ApeA N-terminal domain 1-containing protein [Acinetobacter variabilis]|uniref:ApeA N-terminal domain 1-containing protein n=1 Tax=Acinetobacter variabilis TaxID=70346 RepID=UPI00403DEC8B
MRIADKYIKTGYFWLPGKEDIKIPGVLSIIDGGEAELEIIGHFHGIESFNSPDNLERILGLVEGDGLVTLDNCFYSKKNFSFGGISKSIIFVNKVFCGANWDKDEPTTFNTFSFEVDCLDEWIGISGIAVDGDDPRLKTTITYTPPEKRIFELANGMALEIGFAYTLPGFPNLKEAKVTQRAYFRLVSEELHELNEFISIASKITNFMCFAIDDVVSIKNVSATSCEIQRKIGENKYPVPIKIYYQSTTYVEKVPNKSWHNMLFTFGTIQDNAQEVFNNWLNAYEYLAPAMNLYFSTKMDAQKYLEGKFLALAQGLETYHRRTSNETLMDTDAFTKLVEEIINGCPEGNREWLQGRLMHGNELNLGKRLKCIIEPFKKYLGNSGERSKLLRSIVNTRNYLTHYSKSLEGEAANGTALWEICEKIEAIFNLHFLKVIGFTTEEISSVVENSRSLQSKLKS